MTRFGVQACMGLSSMLLGLSCSAQPISTIFVSAPWPLPGSELTLAQFAAPVQQLRFLDDLSAQNLGDLMGRHLGGLMVQDMQGNALQSDVHYRGFTASPLLGTPQGLSVYLDGVRMNQPFGDVVSWDLIPRAALQSLTLMPGSNPLFGLNTLGGSVALQTKDGRSAPGTSTEFKFGSHDRRSLLLEHGFANELGLDGYSMVNFFHDGGWRKQSPSDVRQLFTKLRWREGDTRSQLSMAWADNDLHGNGLQEGSQLSQNWKSVYTTPDTTNHQAFMLNWMASHEVNDRWTVSTQIYARGQNDKSLNGDINEASLEQAPTSYGECLAHALARFEPAEVCTGLLTRIRTTQRNHGIVLQSNWVGQQGASKTQTLLGVALDIGQINFKQWGQAGFVGSDGSVSGVPAWSNGINGGDINGQPWDNDVELRGRNKTSSLFTSRTWSWGEGWNLTTSGRYNSSHIRNLDLRNSGSPASLSGDHQFKRFNPAIGLTLAPSPIWQGWLGYNEGSRTPTSTELGCANPEVPCRLPNAMASDPPLKQVVTRTFDVGMRGLWSDRHRWSASVFRAVSDDDILFVASEQSGFGYFRNFGQTLRQGFELSFSGPLNARWQYGLHYNWLKASYQSAEMVGGNSNSSNSEGPGLDGHIQIRPGDRIPLIPSQMLKLQLSYKPSAAWRFGLDLQAVGRSSARGNENGQHLADGVYYTGSGHNPGYAVIHLSAKFAPSPGWNLSAQINNLLDMRYTTAAVLSPNAFMGKNVVTQPFGANAQGEFPLRHGTFYAPGEPRNIWLGARYAWR